MGYKNNPMMAVDDAVYELRRLSNLCHVMTFLKEDRSEVVCTDDVSDVMGVLRDCLDQQIKALDSIQWSEARRRTEVQT